jgi:hypothetical protein
MNQAAAETKAFTNRGNGAATAPERTVADYAASVESAWKRNLTAGAEALRAIQHHNAEFTGRMIDLQLQAARSFSADEPWEARVRKPLELGASAIELYMGYLGQSFAIAQKAIVLPWVSSAERN